MNTYLAKPGEVERKWWVVNAEGKVLGRLATRVATVLVGKHKPVLTPSTDTGDFVIVVNAEKVKLTGQKLEKKFYYRASGWHSGLKKISAGKMMQKHPKELIKQAVFGMLAKNKSRQHIMKKLKIYAGPEHPHAVQKPEPLEV